MTIHRGDSRDGPSVTERSEEQVQQEIRETVAKNPIVVFMKGNASMPQCGFSAAVVQILNAHGHPFTSVDVLADPLVREGVKRFTRWPTIPQVFLGGEFIGGCDIVRELEARGELGPKMKQLFADTPPSR